MAFMISIGGQVELNKKSNRPHSNHDLPIADRVFKTEQHDSQVVKPNQFWAGDITYVATDEG